jgi:hypothetical protein
MEHPINNAAPAPTLRGSLMACAMFSLAVLAVAAFDMSLTDWFPGLYFFPVQILLLISFLVCCIWSLVLLRHVARGHIRFAMPLLVCALTLVALIYAPFTRIWLHGNFWWYRTAREEIVARVESGELAPNVDYNSRLITLGNREPRVSSGNYIVIDRTADGIYVLFMTSRGMRHYFSGFVHVPPGGGPAKFFEFNDKPPTQVVRYDKDWYFVAN